MPCTSTASDRATACCEDCEHDEIACPDCCRCVPRYLCIGFYPDDLSLAPTAALVQHQGDGLYASGLGFAVSIAADVNGVCAWIVDGEEAHGIYEEFGLYAYGCLTEDGQTLQLSGITVSGEVGTLIIEMHARTRVPLETTEGGCTQPVCSNCVCLPECVCVRQRILYIDEHPPTKDWSDETTLRSVLACRDEVGSYFGAWRAQFDEDYPNCWPSLDVLIELVPDEDGTCKLQATLNGDGPKDSEVPLDCDTISGLWHWDWEDPETPGLPAEIAISIGGQDCRRDDCAYPCCPNFPAGLNATIAGHSSDGGPCADPFAVPLDRIACSTLYRGTASFAWECDEEGPGNQDVLIEVNPCNGCLRNYVDDICECGQCDGTENPGVNGCGVLWDLQFTHPTDPDFGGLVGNAFSKCGLTNGWPWPGGQLVESICDPVYLEFLVPVQGIADCCDSWHITVTE